MNHISTSVLAKQLNMNADSLFQELENKGLIFRNDAGKYNLTPAGERVGGILKELGWMAVIPWLLYYNIIFVLPMLAITAIVYGGYAGVEKIGGWRQRNIGYLHLVAGIILVVLGALILSGMLY